MNILFLASLLFVSQAVWANSWHGVNAKKIEELIAKFGKSSSQYDPKQRPVAAFDWDNTVIKNDACDATFSWMLSHGKIKKPKDWSKTSAFLSDEALRLLNKNCNDMRAESCINTIFSFYVEGANAWMSTYDADLLEPSYAWSVQLMAGYTPNEIRDFARKALEFSLNNKIGSQQKVGNRTFEAWIRYYEPMKGLIKKMQSAGFDVWIISASSQYIVEVFAEKVGIASDRVIGVRSQLDSKGRLTPHFEACGTHPTGNQTLISYRQGKRCWLNKVVFKMNEAKAMMDMPSPLLFAAGDSDTDAFFLKDARELKLVINRNKPEIMCRAYENKDGKWIINPMFIDPKPKLEKNYSCQKFGIPDQKDLIYH